MPALNARLCAAGYIRGDERGALLDVPRRLAANFGRLLRQLVGQEGHRPVIRIEPPMQPEEFAPLVLAAQCTSSRNGFPLSSSGR